ncbi:MAG: DUF4159 domain-containing protein [Candidatus Sumerlaeota bacterium]|nr:DUF4159 domain-containing protein [Candidatus Sumerlaeota bacterium]
MSARLRGLVCAATVFAFLLAAFPTFSQISCGEAPKADKQRRKAAEGFPPLPLPATPLRRSEKKRPPAPPTLMAKVNYASEHVGDSKNALWNWTSAAGDTQGLFRYARAKLGINYKADVLRLDSFSWAPERVPIMYITGREPVAFTAQEKARIREYIESGGFIFGDANKGSDAFTKTFKAEMQALFPDRPWHRLPADHPIFHSNAAMDKVEVNLTGQKRTEPIWLEGLNIGFRTAIIFSPYGCGCGWDGHTHDDGKLLMPGDACQLGANMLAYSLAYYRVGRSQAVTTIFSKAEPGPDEISIAQLRHGGDWDPDPSGLSYLLKAVGEQTTGDVKFRRIPLDPEDSTMFSYPFVYLTGQLNFVFSKQAQENLRAYLERGGFILIVNASNRIDFDRAVRREMKAALPDKQMAALPDDHPLFSSQNKIPAVPQLQSAEGAKSPIGTRPEGIDINGRLGVVYIPVAVGAAWQDAELPFVPTPDHRYALQLGVNAVVYAMTH